MNFNQIDNIKLFKKPRKIYFWNKELKSVKENICYFIHKTRGDWVSLSDFVRV